MEGENENDRMAQVTARRRGKGLVFNRNAAQLFLQERQPVADLGGGGGGGGGGQIPTSALK